jgi:exopolyphosphatase/guanosine-5'-triphosphate,3'-diphosphate pyrophosphatase
MQRIAAIDAGSNAIRLVVATLSANRKVEVLENIRVPVRLGQDVFTNEFLEERTIQQAVNAFTQFQHVIEDMGVSWVRAVGTSALREAKNRDILIDRIFHSSGIELKVINGEEEARLVHLAVSEAIDLAEKRAVLVDIGGGSVEITVVDGDRIQRTDSYNMGTVRLLQRLGGDEKAGTTRNFSLLVREYAEAARHRIKQEIGESAVDLCIGTGGNVEEIGKLRQRFFTTGSDQMVTTQELETLIDRLVGMSYRERMRKFNMRPDRADVIMPAAIVLHRIALEIGIAEIQIPKVGLKNGILADMAQHMTDEYRFPYHDQAWASAIRLGEKYQFDAKHAELVAKLAGQFFDQTQEITRADGEGRLILELGALLHDIGHFISTVDHDRHGYYLLTANHILGLSERQQEMVACLVRFHRKAYPFQDCWTTDLIHRDRLTVAKMSALHRMADALDSSHTQRVTGVEFGRTKNGWKVHIQGKGDLTLEKWAFSRRSTLFEELFGARIEIDG